MSFLHKVNSIKGSEYDPILKQELRNQGPENIAGVFSTFNHSWLACGSKIYVLNNSDGSVQSSWKFGESSSDLVEVTCATELRIEGCSIPLLIVGVCSESTYKICFFNPNTRKIVRAVECNFPVRVLCVIEDGLREVNPLNEALIGTQGLLAIGCADGSLYIMDLCRDIILKGLNGDFRNVSDEESPAEVNCIDVLSVTPSLVQQKLKDCHNSLSSLAVRLDGDCDEGVTALCYSLESAVLHVGTSAGSFILWNMTSLNCLFHSQGLSQAIISISLLEPCDDPRHNLFLWICYEDSPQIHMYCMTFASKFYVDGYGVYYQGFESAGLVYRLSLGRDDNLSAARTINAVSVTKSLPRNLVKSLNIQDSDSTQLRLFVTCYETASRVSQAVVFDLNQWYKEQMPEEGLSSCVESVVLDCNGVRYLTVDAGSLCHYQSVRPLEQHFHPSALDIHFWCIDDDGVRCIEKLGLQSQWLRNMSIAGPSVLLNPQQIFHGAISAGLLPTFNDPPDPECATVEEERTYVLTVCLENRITSVIEHCAREWSTGSHPVAGCTLNFLVDWLWELHGIYKSHGNKMCVPLFDQSGLEFHVSERRALQHCKSLLSTVQTLFASIIKKYRQFIIADGLEQKVAAMTLVRFYFDCCLKLISVNLLPEPNEAGRPASSLTYKYAELNKFVSNKRKIVPFLGDSLLGEDGCREREWEEEGGTGRYPPPTIQAVLRYCLHPSPTIYNKLSLLLYLYMDIINSHIPIRDPGSTEKVKNFQYLLRIPDVQFRIVAAFWYLDHNLFYEGTSLLLDYNVLSVDLTDDQHRSVLSLLALQGQEKLALQYLRLKATDLHHLTDFRLELELLLNNRLVNEAFMFQRKHPEYQEELLTDFFQGCIQKKLLGQVFGLHLDPKEESVLFKFLKTSNLSNKGDLQVLLLLSRAKYNEAMSLNDRLNLSLNGPKSKLQVATRDMIVRGITGGLNSISRDLAQEMRHYRPPPPGTHPRPLSALIKIRSEPDGPLLQNDSKFLLSAAAKSACHLSDYINIDSGKSRKRTLEENGNLDIYVDDPPKKKLALGNGILRQLTSVVGSAWPVTPRKPTNRQELEVMELVGTPLVKKKGKRPSPHSKPSSILKAKTPDRHTILEEQNETPSRKTLRFALPENDGRVTGRKSLHPLKIIDDEPGVMESIRDRLRSSKNKLLEDGGVDWQSVAETSKPQKLFTLGKSKLKLKSEEQQLSKKTDAKVPPQDGLDISLAAFERKYLESPSREGEPSPVTQAVLNTTIAKRLFSDNQITEDNDLAVHNEVNEIDQNQESFLETYKRLRNINSKSSSSLSFMKKFEENNAEIACEEPLCPAGNNNVESDASNNNKTVCSASKEEMLSPVPSSEGKLSKSNQEEEPIVEENKMAGLKDKSALEAKSAPEIHKESVTDKKGPGFEHKESLIFTGQNENIVSNNENEIDLNKRESEALPGDDDNDLKVLMVLSSTDVESFDVISSDGTNGDEDSPQKNVIAEENTNDSDSVVCLSSDDDEVDEEQSVEEEQSVDDNTSGSSHFSMDSQVYDDMDDLDYEALGIPRNDNQNELRMISEEIDKKETTLCISDDDEEENESHANGSKKKSTSILSHHSTNKKEIARNDDDDHDESSGEQELDPLGSSLIAHVFSARDENSGVLSDLLEKEDVTTDGESENPNVNSNISQNQSSPTPVGSSSNDENQNDNIGDDYEEEEDTDAMFEQEGEEMRNDGEEVGYEVVLLNSDDENENSYDIEFNAEQDNLEDSENNDADDDDFIEEQVNLSNESTSYDSDNPVISITPLKPSVIKVASKYEQKCVKTSEPKSEVKPAPEKCLPSQEACDTCWRPLKNEEDSRQETTSSFGVGSEDGESRSETVIPPLISNFETECFSEQDPLSDICGQDMRETSGPNELTLKKKSNEDDDSSKLRDNYGDNTNKSIDQEIAIKSLSPNHLKPSKSFNEYSDLTNISEKTALVDEPKEDLLESAVNENLPSKDLEAKECQKNVNETTEIKLCFSDNDERKVSESNILQETSRVQRSEFLLENTSEPPGKDDVPNYEPREVELSNINNQAGSFELPVQKCIKLTNQNSFKQEQVGSPSSRPPEVASQELESSVQMEDISSTTESNEQYQPISSDLPKPAIEFCDKSAKIISQSPEKSKDISVFSSAPNDVVASEDKTSGIVSSQNNVPVRCADSIKDVGTDAHSAMPENEALPDSLLTDHGAVPSDSVVLQDEYPSAGMKEPLDDGLENTLSSIPPPMQIDTSDVSNQVEVQPAEEPTPTASIPSGLHLPIDTSDQANVVTTGSVEKIEDLTGCAEVTPNITTTEKSIIKKVVDVNDEKPDESPCKKVKDITKTDNANEISMLSKSHVGGHQELMSKENISPGEITSDVLVASTAPEPPKVPFQSFFFGRDEKSETYLRTTEKATYQVGSRISLPNEDEPVNPMEIAMIEVAEEEEVCSEDICVEDEEIDPRNTCMLDVDLSLHLSDDESHTTDKPKMIDKSMVTVDSYLTRKSRRTSRNTDSSKGNKISESTQSCSYNDALKDNKALPALLPIATSKAAAVGSKQSFGTQASDDCFNSKNPSDKAIVSTESLPNNALETNKAEPIGTVDDSSDHGDIEGMGSSVTSENKPGVVNNKEKTVKSCKSDEKVVDSLVDLENTDDNKVTRRSRRSSVALLNSVGTRDLRSRSSTQSLVSTESLKEPEVQGILKKSASYVPSENKDISEVSKKNSDDESVAKHTRCSVSRNNWEAHHGMEQRRRGRYSLEPEIRGILKHRKRSSCTSETSLDLVKRIKEDFPEVKKRSRRYSEEPDLQGILRRTESLRKLKKGSCSESIPAAHNDELVKAECSKACNLLATDLENPSSFGSTNLKKIEPKIHGILKNKHTMKMRSCVSKTTDDLEFSEMKKEDKKKGKKSHSVEECADKRRLRRHSEEPEIHGILKKRATRYCSSEITEDTGQRLDEDFPVHRRRRHSLDPASFRDDKRAMGKHSKPESHGILKRTGKPDRGSHSSESVSDHGLHLDDFPIDKRLRRRRHSVTSSDSDNDKKKKRRHSIGHGSSEVKEASKHTVIDNERPSTSRDHSMDIRSRRKQDEKSEAINLESDKYMVHSKREGLRGSLFNDEADHMYKEPSRKCSSEKDFKLLKSCRTAPEKKTKKISGDTSSPSISESSNCRILNFSEEEENIRFSRKCKSLQDFPVGRRRTRSTLCPILEDEQEENEEEDESPQSKKKSKRYPPLIVVNSDDDSENSTLMKDSWNAEEYAKERRLTRTQKKVLMRNASLLEEVSPAISSMCSLNTTPKKSRKKTATPESPVRTPTRVSLRLQKKPPSEAE